MFHFVDSQAMSGWFTRQTPEVSCLILYLYVCCFPRTLKQVQLRTLGDRLDLLMSSWQKSVRLE